MSQITITLLFLAFAIIMFMLEKIPLGVTSMIVCVGLVVTGVLDWQTAFSGFIDSNVILFVAMFIVGGALFETGDGEQDRRSSYTLCQDRKAADHCDHGDCRSDEWLPFQHRNSRNPDSGSYWYRCKIRIFKIKTVNAVGICSSHGR